MADTLSRVVCGTALPAPATALTLDVTRLTSSVYTVRCAAATARLVVE